MKHCPTCRNKYPDDLNFCLVDGIRLKVSDPSAETLRVRKPSFQLKHSGATIMKRSKVIKKSQTARLEFPPNIVSVFLRDIEEVDLPSSIHSKSISQQWVAKLAFEIQPGERLFIGGPLTKCVHLNGYYVPETQPHDDGARSVYVFHLTSKHVTFWTLEVNDISIAEQKVKVTMTYFRYPKA